MARGKSMTFPRLFSSLLLRYSARALLADNNSNDLVKRSVRWEGSKCASRGRRRSPCLFSFSYQFYGSLRIHAHFSRVPSSFLLHSSGPALSKDPLHPRSHDAAGRCMERGRRPQTLFALAALPARRRRCPEKYGFASSRQL